MNSRFPMTYDWVVLGSGVSGSIWAHHLVNAGHSTLLVEAGKYFERPQDYPRTESAANTELYWHGGAELNTQGDLAFLRPRVVGGGTVVNQALLDEFTPEVFEDWKQQTGVDFFSAESLQPHYARARSFLKQHTFTDSEMNANARLFAKGCEDLHFQWKHLTRAQNSCASQGQAWDCMKCLYGCTQGSKQSFDRVFIDALMKHENFTLYSETRALAFQQDPSKLINISLTHPHWGAQKVSARNLVLAMGAIGNTLFLMNSGIRSQAPILGEDFHTHPQYMSLGVFPQKLHSEQGFFQTVKSADPRFTALGFKLENVFAPRIALSLLIDKHGAEHTNLMKQSHSMSCIEVAIRDTHPGQLKRKSATQIEIRKSLDKTDHQKKIEGLKRVHAIFKSQGVLDIHDAEFGVGLHLMGACKIGTEKKHSVINESFNLWNHPRIYCSDSSIFPSAPGINPSLTIMALSHKAALEALE